MNSIFDIRAGLRTIVKAGVGLLAKHPRLDSMVRRLYRRTPGMVAMVRRMRGGPRKEAVFPQARPFEPLPVGPDGIVTVEGLYHLSRSL